MAVEQLLVHQKGSFAPRLQQTITSSMGGGIILALQVGQRVQKLPLCSLDLTGFSSFLLTQTSWLVFQAEW